MGKSCRDGGFTDYREGFMVVLDVGEGIGFWDVWGMGWNETRLSETGKGGERLGFVGWGCWGCWWRGSGIRGV